MQLVNLTPHALTIVGEGFQISLSKPDQAVPRVSETWEDLTPINVNGNAISVAKKTLSTNVENMPEPQEDTIFIVSALVMQALPHRKDIMSPGVLVRDEEGNIIGCKGLSAL